MFLTLDGKNLLVLKNLIDIAKKNVKIYKKTEKKKTSGV